MKQLPFVCPICGGRLIKSIFKTGTDDYYVSKTGKSHKTPFRKASKNLGEIDCTTFWCENYPDSCNFSTDGDLKVEDYNLRDKYKIVVDMDNDSDVYYLYKNEEQE